MSSPRADRALRRLIAEIANLDVEDLGAILADLDSQHRDRVLELIAAYQGSPARALPVTDAQDSSGLSPWLTIRLTAATGIDHALTPTAHAALKATVRRRSASP